MTIARHTHTVGTEVAFETLSISDKFEACEYSEGIKGYAPLISHSLS